MSDPTQGAGSGGDRCTEAVGAMIDATYKIGPWAQDGKHTVEQIMFQFTENLNQGRDVSAPENASWISDWVRANTNGQMSVGDVTWPTFQDVVACVDRGHIAIGGFDDYVNLRLSSGENPYKWNDPHGLGHVLLIVGYDTEKHVVVVHDPLRADPGGQPADYSWTGFQAAQFHDLCEVHGAPLPLAEGSGTPQTDGQGNPAEGSESVGIPDGWHDNGTTLTAPNGVVVVMGFREWILSHTWDSIDYPMAAERVLPSIEPGNPSIGAGSRQDFRMTSLGWTTSRGVYKIWVGQDIRELEAQVARLEAQLKAAAPTLDMAALKADAATIQAALKPLEAQEPPLQAAEAAVIDIQQKLGS
jgi:hypothetical protein